MIREERIDWLCRLRCWIVVPPLMTAEQKSKFIEALTETIEALQEEPCEDCISRQAVHDMLENLPITVEDKWFNWLQKACIRLAKLPSVQPKSEDSKFLEFLMNAINPNEMEQYLAMYHSKGEKTNG